MNTTFKYMTFNSSCSYAGLANMLLRYGVDTQDREIARDMKLPFLFACEEDEYRAGPMLQGAQWFNLYLHPRGLEMRETEVPAQSVAAYLRRQRTAMLGIREIENGKHAVVYIGNKQEKLLFLNNKWERADAPTQLLLTEQALLSYLDDKVIIATLATVAPCKVDIISCMRRSITVLQQNAREICMLCQETMPVAVLRSRMDSLFRALLLDGITMLNLLGESDLVARLLPLQRGLLNAVRNEPEANVSLGDYLSPDALTAAAQAYAARIQREIDNMGN